jgi:hypothetical protein
MIFPAFNPPAIAPIACAAGTSPAATEAAINFSNPSKDV